jgi:hypothetical protein
VQARIDAISPNDKGNPPGKLAEAELHFGGQSPLAGLKLIGFSILGTSRRQRPERHVPGAVVRGERRPPQLRAAAPDVDTTAQEAVRERILEAYAEYEDAPERATA